ncbi:MAG: asparaginase, partial [Gemmatimonadota bacterium]
EGVYAVAARDRGWGMGVKVRDGAPRAVEPALVAVLDALEWIQGAQRRMLDRWLRPVIRNMRDEAVGEIRARVELAGPGGTA